MRLWGMTMGSLPAALLPLPLTGGAAAAMPMLLPVLVGAATPCM